MFLSVNAGAHARQSLNVITHREFIDTLNFPFSFLLLVIFFLMKEGRQQQNQNKTKHNRTLVIK
jgi:hypothetical protein